MSSWAIPMVCFCDIPLSNIENHMSKYGDYAIGLNYKWAKKNGINPVWYIKLGSIPARNMKTFYTNRDMNILLEKDDSPKGNKMMCNLFYTKKFSTIIKKPSPLKNETIRYYDEREWRYIPYLFDGDERLFLSEEEYKDRIRRDNVNGILRSHPLCFTPSDINYIIVRRDSELLRMKDLIEETKMAYSKEDRELLGTKLISAQRIKSDF